MSCAEWMDAQRNPLHPDELTGEDRNRLIRHLDKCDECRRAALRGDPTIVFSLRDGSRVDDVDPSAMIDSVRALRRLRQLEQSAPRRRRLAGGGIAAAFLGAALLMLAPSGPDRPGTPWSTPGGSGGGVPVEQEQQFTGFGTLPPAVQAPSIQERPILEDLDRREARVYQVDEEDLSVVMVVDESLDL